MISAELLQTRTGRGQAAGSKQHLPHGISDNAHLLDSTEQTTECKKGLNACCRNSEPISMPLCCKMGWLTRQRRSKIRGSDEQACWRKNRKKGGSKELSGCRKTKKKVHLSTWWWVRDWMPSTLICVLDSEHTAKKNICTILFFPPTFL